MRFPRMCMPNQRLLAYVAVVLAFVAAIAALDARANARAHRVDQNRTSVRITCEKVNDLKHVLATMINNSAGPTPIPANADQALRDVITQSNLRAAVFRQQALDALAPTDCTNLVTNRPSTTTTTVGVDAI